MGATSDTEDDMSDVESVISTSTVRSRPYLLPTTTTGRVSHTGSRPGSMRSYRSNYDLNEKPPPYISAQKDDMEIMAPNDDGEISFYGESMRDITRGGGSLAGGVGGGGYTNPMMKRSSSMVDMRTRHSSGQQQQQQQPSSDFRRSQSVVDLAGGGGEYDISPAHSEWSIRTAPQTHARRPPSVVSSSGGRSHLSHPAMTSSSMMKRSMSQPNLHQRNTMTYPQGILKRTSSQGYGIDSSSPAVGGSASVGGGGSSRYYLGKTNNSSDSGVKDLYYDHDLGRGYHTDPYSEKAQHDPYLAYGGRPASSVVGYGRYGGGGGGSVYNSTHDPYDLAAAAPGVYSSRPSRHQQMRRHPPQQHHMYNRSASHYHPQHHHHHHPTYATMSDYGGYDAYNNGYGHQQQRSRGHPQQQQQQQRQRMAAYGKQPPQNNAAATRMRGDPYSMYGMY